MIDQMRMRRILGRALRFFGICALIGTLITFFSSIVTSSYTPIIKAPSSPNFDWVYVLHSSGTGTSFGYPFPWIDIFSERFTAVTTNFPLSQLYLPTKPPDVNVSGHTFFLTGFFLDILIYGFIFGSLILLSYYAKERFYGRKV